MTDTLSTVASRIHRAQAAHFEHADADMAFDGGEFSGPALTQGLLDQVAEILADAGWTGERFEQELIARTSDKYAYFSGLTDWLPQQVSSPHAWM